MWDKFRESVDTVQRPGSTILAPTAEDLDRFERELEFELPASYRSYMLEIGPGSVGEYYIINAPLYRHPQRGMQREVKQLQKDALLSEIYGGEFVSRMIPFATSIGGDIFAWDPTTPAAGKKLDYTVFVLPRDLNRVVKVAKDFESFVYQVCLGRGLSKALPYVQGYGRFKRVFVPESVRTAGGKKPAFNKPTSRTKATPTKTRKPPKAGPKSKRSKAPPRRR
jgi:hypothetical protein